MDQETRWVAKYNELVVFIQSNKRNPSRYDAEERGRYCNWLKYQRKLYNVGEMKEDRVAKFEELIALMEKYRRKNQYE